jgi:hypothetical protein
VRTMARGNCATCAHRIARERLESEARRDEMAGTWDLADPDNAFDPERECRHTPAQRYTRRPCSCGRTLWPPHGRGRGESLTSPRRVDAKLKALEAMHLHVAGETYKDIARRLGYRSASGAWMAVQRLRDADSAWRRWELETGQHEPVRRHAPASRRPTRRYTASSRS